MTVGQACCLHSAPVVHGDGVELEVKLVSEVERHLLGTLRLDDSLVLIEDRLFEILEHRVGLVEVVVTSDDAVATATVLADRLTDIEICLLYTSDAADE